MSIISQVGQLASGLRAGEGTLILNQPYFEAVPATLQVSSPAFRDGEPMPVRFTVEGSDISPPLVWRNLPAGTVELVLIVEDYDVPLLRPLAHALVYGLAPTGSGLIEGALPNRDGALPNRDGAGLDPSPKLGKNSMGHQRYDGPAPIPGHGPHHYVFQLFALDRALEFEKAPDKGALVAAMENHLLATGQLTGTFART